MITTPGEKVIDLEVYAESGVLLGTNEMIVTSDCEIATYDVSIDLGKNQDIAECGQESSLIFAIVNGEHTTPNDQYSYVWSSTDEGIIFYSPGFFSNKYRIDTPGGKVIDLEVYSQSGDLLGTSEITVTSNCDTQEPADNEFNIDNCAFPYYHQYATPQPSDGVEWEVETGYADFTQVDNLLTVNEATDGTIMLMTVYYNGNFTITPYVLNVAGDCEEEKITLEGHVTANGNMWDYGMIYLYDISEAEAVDSVSFENGIYLFRNLSVGTYTLYAVPYTDNSLTEIDAAFVSTYYVNKLNREEANTFEITDNTFGVDIDLIDQLTASVDDFNGVEVATYPNPFSDELTINSDLVGAEITVSTTQGNIIYNGVLEQSTNINTADWINGVYFIEVKTQGGVQILKVLK